MGGPGSRRQWWTSVWIGLAAVVLTGCPTGSSPPPNSESSTSQDSSTLREEYGLDQAEPTPMQDELDLEPVPPWAEQVKALEAAEANQVVSEESVTPEQLAELATSKQAREQLEIVKLPNARWDDDDLRMLSQFTNLRVVQLDSCHAGDEGLKVLASLLHLERLNLADTSVTDEGLVAWEGHERLQSLRIGSSRLSDDALQSIRKLPALRFLHLMKAPVTDEGLEHLHGMSQLESLYLDESKVTADGLRKLKQSVSQPLHIHLDQQHL